MSKYHNRTLELLGLEKTLAEQPTPALIEWAKVNNITLPAAYLEWTCLDRQNLLGKYSNDDWFGFDQPDVVTTPEGVRGLLFNVENQGNFSKIVSLDQGDDPPVFFAWVGTPPWLTHTERFSDCVFAQIFDWQYWLEFNTDDPDFKEIAYTGNIELPTSRCLEVLRGQYTETVTTRFVIEAERFTEYRFWKSSKERINVTVGENSPTYIRITGEPDFVIVLEAELLEVFRENNGC